LLSLLIVDDESAIIDDIKATLSSENIGIDCIYQANSGTEAIGILNQHSVDFVITDIRMPGMNGIELVKTIKVKWKHIKCILLSGYAEFTYAQEAVKHDVVDYLLKPITDQKLLMTIRATLQMIEEEKKELTFYSKIKSALKENIPSLQQKLLSDLIEGKHIEETHLTDLLELYQIPNIMNESYVTMVSRFNEDMNWDQENLLEYAIGNIMEETFNDFYLMSTSRNHLFVVLIFLKPEVREKHPSFIHEQNAFEKIVERLAVQLQDSVKFYLNVTFSFSLSRSNLFPSDVAHIYRSLESSFVRNPNQSGIQSQRMMETQEFQSLISLLESPTLMHLFEAGRWDLIDGKLRQIFRDLKENTTISREHILEIYFIISNSIFYFLHRNGNFLTDVQSENAEEFIRRLPFFSIERFEKWTFGITFQIKEIMNIPRKSNHAHIMQKIHDYISRHVETDVSLQTIADHVYLHPVYLSKLFKFETGEGLSEYVQRIRLEKAAYMLLHTGEKIYKISEKIGLQDPSYFIRVFKKYFGMTPQQYRNGAMLKFE
jgi:two-component system response regulator YesN